MPSFHASRSLKVFTDTFAPCGRRAKIVREGWSFSIFSSQSVPRTGNGERGTGNGGRRERGTENGEHVPRPLVPRRAPSPVPSSPSRPRLQSDLSVRHI